MTRHRILVTGLAGFVGSVLQQAVRVERQASDIELLPLASEAGAPVDIRDAAAVTEAVERSAPTAVVHLAAVASPRLAAERPDEAWAVNVMGTFNLARAVQMRAPDARFVLASSSEVYGASFQTADGPIREESALEPLNPYGATKAAADLMIGQMARQGLRALRFRPFNHTGAGQSQLYVISSFARQIVRIEMGLQAPVMRVGNLAVRRDFLDAHDVARAYLDSALGRGGDARGAFNLATGRPIPIGAMLEMLLGLIKTPVTVETDPALLRANEAEVLSGDAGKADRELDWRATIPIEETLRSVLEYWRVEAKACPQKLRE